MCIRDRRSPEEFLNYLLRGCVNMTKFLPQTLKIPLFNFPALFTVFKIRESAEFCSKHDKRKRKKIILEMLLSSSEWWLPIQPNLHHLLPLLLLLLKHKSLNSRFKTTSKWITSNPGKKKPCMEEPVRYNQYHLLLLILFNWGTKIWIYLRFCCYFSHCCHSFFTRTDK